MASYPSCRNKLTLDNRNIFTLNAAISDRIICSPAKKNEYNDETITPARPGFKRLVIGSAKIKGHL
jgi:hypothetical protein